MNAALIERMRAWRGGPRGISAAQACGDVRVAREMQVFLRRVRRAD